MKKQELVNPAQDGFADFKKRDGKVTSYSGGEGLARLASALIVKLPLLLVGVLPVQILYSVVSALLKPFQKKKVEENLGDDDNETDFPLAENLTPRDERPYDLVLFGVTGFTGGLAAEYVAKQYGNKIKWAIAGRKESALQSIRTKLTAINASLSNLPLIVADSADIESLANMCRQTRVVASSVGPFAKYGSPLVKQCIRHQTDYCDTTGEVSWIRLMIEKYHLQAKKFGVRLVPLSGNDCVPYDLMVHQLAKKLRERDEKLVNVELMDDFKSAPSGGTIGTMIYHLTQYRPPKSSLGFNPIDMKQDGTKSSNKVVSKTKGGPGYSSQHKSWYTFFVLSGVNKECVRRSNALNDYSDKFVYKEQLVLPNFGATISWVIENVLTGLFLTNGWLRSLGFAVGIIPKPGQGPSEKDMAEGFLLLTGYGKGDKGSKAVAELYYPVDPGYRDTARMLVESGLSMALERSSLPSGMDGIVTPASGLGDVMLNRLLATGCEFQSQFQ